MEMDNLQLSLLNYLPFYHRIRVFRVVGKNQDVGCTLDRKRPHLLRIEKVYMFNNKPYAYCPRHNDFFYVGVPPLESVEDEE